MRRGLLTAGITAGLIGLGSLSAASASAATEHPAHVSGPAVVVGGKGTSTQQELINLLTGSPSVAIYSLTPVLALDDGHSVPISAPSEIVARTLGGTTTVLAPSPDGTVLGGWSMSGDTLTATSPGNPPTHVDWWDVSTDAHGRVAIPAGGTYVSAAPGGFLTMSADGTLSTTDVATAMTTTLDQPFTSRPAGMSAAADANGVVLGDSAGHARYVAFADPSTVKNLQTNSTAPIVCAAVSSSYAACDIGVSGEGRPQDPALIPLDGSAPTVPGDGRATGPLALTDSGILIWERFGANSETRVLASMSPGDTAPTIGTLAVAEGQLVSALGVTVTTPTAQHRIFTAAAADDTLKIVSAPRSPVTVAGFALTSTTVIDADDLVDPRQPGSIINLRSRTVTGTDGTLSVGKAQVLANSPGEHNRIINVVAANGSTVAYETSTGFPATLHVIRGSHPITIHNVRPDAAVTISGRWMAYDISPPGSGFDQLHVRNLVTGRDKVYGHHGDGLYLAAAASAGHLNFATRSGSVLRVNLANGHRTRLAPAIKNHNFESIRLYAYHGKVGWEVERGGQNNRTYVDTVIRTGSTAHHVIHLRKRLIGLSAAGMLLAAVAPDVEGSAPYSFGLTAIGLRNWHDQVENVLATADYVGVPKMTGHRVAWINAHGVLKVGLLPVPG